MGTNTGKFDKGAIAVAELNGQRVVRTQFGALCFRLKKGEEAQVLLVTSRTTRRWIVPKGWPMTGTSPAQAARTEAWEEAGVRGRISPACLGVYSYTKLSDDRFDEDTPCVVALYPMRVQNLARDYPEKGQRKRKWFSLKKAAARVREPELSDLILDFRPDLYFA